MNKIRIISIRITEDLYKDLQNKANEQGFERISSYLRLKLIG